MRTAIIVCLSSFVALVWILRHAQVSLGLPIAYLANLLILHVPGALAQLFATDRTMLTPIAFTRGGIIYTAIGSAAFVVGVFVIHLPLKEGEAQAVQARDTPRQVLRLRPGQATCRVLIADDIEDNRQLLAQLLGPVGFEIRLATNGAEAVQEFEQWQPHLILMDFRMPIMDGHEAIRQIRAMAGGKEPKIIAVTASAMDENRQDLIAIGADDFLSKPFREVELFQKIHHHTGMEYVYAEQPTAAEEEATELTAESLAGWPPDLLQPMRDAVITADLDQLLAKIQDVETRDPGIARGLRRLAESFQYQKLLDLLSTGGVL